MIFMDKNFEEYPADPYMIRYLIDKECLDNFYVTIPIVLRNDLLDIILDEANLNNNNRIISFTLKCKKEETEASMGNLIYFNNPLIEQDHRLEDILLGYRLQDFISGKYHKGKYFDRMAFHDPDGNTINRDLLTILTVRLKKLWDQYTNNNYNFDRFFDIEIFSLQETGVGFEAEGYGYNIVNMMLKIKYKESHDRYKIEKILKLALTRIIMLNYCILDTLIAIYYENLQYNKNFISSVWLRDHMNLYMKTEFNDSNMDILKHFTIAKGLQYSIEVMRYITRDLGQNEIVALELYNKLIADSETEEEIFDNLSEVKLEINQPWTLERYDRFIITPMSFTDSTMVNCDVEPFYINKANDGFKELRILVPELKLIYDKGYELLPVWYSTGYYEGTDFKENDKDSMNAFLKKNNLPKVFEEMFKFLDISNDLVNIDFDKFNEYLNIRLMDYIDILPKDIYKEIYKDYNTESYTEDNGGFVIDFVNEVIESYNKYLQNSIH